MPCSKYSSKDTRKGKRKEPPSAGCQGDKNRTAEIEADGSPENVRQRYQIAKAKAAEELRRLLQVYIHSWDSERLEMRSCSSEAFYIL